MHCRLETTLDLNEKKKLQQFLKVHKMTCPDVAQCNGHSFVFSNNSGIGTKIEVRCATCATKHDITDYGAW